MARPDALRPRILRRLSAAALIGTSLPVSSPPLFRPRPATAVALVVFNGDYALDGSYALGAGYALTQKYALDDAYALNSQYALARAMPWPRATP